MIRCPSISFDHQIHRRQRWGGISRYYQELQQGLLRRGVSVLPWKGSVRRQAKILHATFYGGQPHRLLAHQRLVSNLHDMTPERHPEHFFSLGGLRSPHANKLTWLAASDLIVSVSAASADDLSFFWPQLTTPLQVIHLATSLDLVPPQPVDELSGQRFWLMVGKRHAYKNSLTVLRALALLRHNNHRSSHLPVLVCAGGGPWRRKEQAWLQSHGLNTAVRQLPAHDPQLAWLYRHAEAVLVPSLAEGFSLPLIEALACNTPVLASDLEVHREVAGSYATLLPALNARAWADALATAARQPFPSPQEALSPERWQALRQHYRVQRLLNDHIAVYTKLHAGR